MSSVFAKYFMLHRSLCGPFRVPVRTGFILGENKMGRPINKKFIGDGVGKIEVTNVQFADTTEAVAEAHIVNQRSSHKFTVSDGVKTEVCTLVNKLPSALAPSEFCIEVVDTTGAVTQVTRLHNRTFQLEDGTVANAPWANAAAGTATTTELAITGASQAATCVILLADTTGLTNGDIVSIKDVVGMVELNIDTGYTLANIVTNTSAELVGINSTGYTLYTSGGVLTSAPTVSAGGIVVDRQSA